jgi:hypothetical protein
MHNASSLPMLVEALAHLATALHLAFEQGYADAHALYARADACWLAGDRAGYARVMQEHARLLARLDDLDALYWATTHAARDLAAHLEEQGNAERL